MVGGLKPARGNLAERQLASARKDCPLKRESGYTLRARVFVRIEGEIEATVIRMGSDEGVR